MKRRVIGFLFVALATLTAANAQVVPAEAVGEDIIGRVFPSIDWTTGQPTGSFAVAVYLPCVAGIPTQYLFKTWATVQDETTSAGVGGVSFRLTTGPSTCSSENFVLPDGTITNLQKLMPGGFTISTITNLGAFVTTAGGARRVVNLATGTGPVVLGSCAVMIPFSGPDFNPGTAPALRGFVSAMEIDGAKTQ